jgi:hypothetical protein
MIQRHNRNPIFLTIAGHDTITPSALGNRHGVEDALHQPCPVLTLWASVVAGRLGFERDEALTLGRAVAGLNVYSKGRSLARKKA